MVGRKEWAADDVLSAAEVVGYLMVLDVTIWANSSARNSGILAPIEGQISYLQDTNLFQAYNGSAWVDQVSLGGTAVYATSAGTAVNANKVGNITIFNSATTPTANAAGDLWFY